MADKTVLISGAGVAGPVLAYSLARHGFRPYGPPIRLPDGPELFPLWREPASKITNRTEPRP